MATDDLLMAPLSEQIREQTESGKSYGWNQLPTYFLTFVKTPFQPSFISTLLKKWIYLIPIPSIHFK